MKKIALLSLSLIVFISCNKEIIPDETTTNQAIQHVDSILYHDFQPDIVITSIDSFTYVGQYDYSDCYRPIPEDSMAYVEVDINQDGINDFRIIHRHWMGSAIETPHNACDKYHNYKTEVEALSANNYVLVDIARQYCVGDPCTLLQTGDPVSLNSSTWYNNSSLYIYASSMLCQNIPGSPDITIGVSLYLNNAHYYGWIALRVERNNFTLKEMAINLAANQSINANQSVNAN